MAQVEKEEYRKGKGQNLEQFSPDQCVNAFKHQHSLDQQSFHRHPKHPPTSTTSTYSGQLSPAQPICTCSTPVQNTAAALSCQITPNTVFHPSQSIPSQHQVLTVSNSRITPKASSSGQVLLGGNVYNFTGSSMPTSNASFLRLSSSPSAVTPRTANYESSTKPFVLKMKTNQIRVCQSCRKDYNGLLVARPERRLVANLATGTQFLGRESNSHYHLHMDCLRHAQPSFSGDQLLILHEMKTKLTAYQKVYLITCIQVPQQSL